MQVSSHRHKKLRGQMRGVQGNSGHAHGAIVFQGRREVGWRGEVRQSGIGLRKGPQ